MIARAGRLDGPEGPIVVSDVGLGPDQVSQRSYAVVPARLDREGDLPQFLDGIRRSGRFPEVELGGCDHPQGLDLAPIGPDFLGLSPRQPEGVQGAFAVPGDGPGPGDGDEGPAPRIWSQSQGRRGRPAGPIRAHPPCRGLGPEP